MKKNNKRSYEFMKKLRKWSRILHRDIGYFFMATTLIYAISGFALNHLRDWNPNYVVTTKNFNVDEVFSKQSSKEEIIEWSKKLNLNAKYKTHYFTGKNIAKIFYTNSITVQVDLNKGTGTIENLKRRPLFYQANFLHYNPNRFWTWFSDAFAIALIIFVITSLFMVKGKKGITGRGGIYFLIGLIIPLVFIFLS